MIIFECIHMTDADRGSIMAGQSTEDAADRRWRSVFFRGVLDRARRSDSSSIRGVFGAMKVGQPKPQSFTDSGFGDKYRYWQEAAAMRIFGFFFLFPCGLTSLFCNLSDVPGHVDFIQICCILILVSRYGKRNKQGQNNQSRGQVVGTVHIYTG